MDRVLALVNILLEELLATVKYLVTVLGLRAPLVSLLHAVFTLVANLLSVLVRLLAGLLPALLGGLTPLLSALGNGLLAPILGPVVDLVNSLAGL